MKRTPPSDIQRELRQEVGFGCPIYGCRKPFLTWHHFDPPWSIRPHHESQGMIALCREHHDFADAGGFSNDELRSLKRKNYTADSVIANFPWAKKSMLIRLGGIYVGGSANVLRVSGDPIVSLTTGPSGMLLLSFSLKLPDGTIAASMIENAFQSDPSTLYDMSCKAIATRVTVWFASRDIGLDLSFRRLTMAELSGILTTDKERTSIQAKPEIEKRLASLPESLKAEIAKGLASEPSWPDKVASTVKQWALENCVDSDGKLTLLDFTNLSVNNAGREIRIRNGIRIGQATMRYGAIFIASGTPFDL